MRTPEMVGEISTNTLGIIDPEFILFLTIATKYLYEIELPLYMPDATIEVKIGRITTLYWKFLLLKAAIDEKIHLIAYTAFIYVLMRFINDPKVDFNCKLSFYQAITKESRKNEFTSIGYEYKISRLAIHRRSPIATDGWNSEEMILKIITLLIAKFNSDNESKDELKGESKDDLKDESKREMKGESKDELKDELKDESKRKSKDELKGESKRESKDELKGKSKRESKRESKDDLKVEI